MSNNNIETLYLCLDCVNQDADPNLNRISEDAIPLSKLQGWILSPATNPETEEPFEPYFSRGGSYSCDGCFTILGGDRYTYTGVSL